MVSQEDLEWLRAKQAADRQAGRLNQELELKDLKQKPTEEELWEALKKSEEARMKSEEARMKAVEAQIKAEKERDDFQYLLAKHKGSVTPTNKGTSGSDGKLSIASRVFRDQLIDIF